MKKSLLALALAAAAVGAQAADVTLYGVVDEALVYSKTKVHGEKNYTNDTFGLESGYNASSRFGVKGTEDLGNGLSVGFKLENGFNADTGSFGDSSRLFNREAALTLKGGFGEVAFGRMGGLTSSAGTYDLFFAQADAFDGGANGITTGFAMSDRYDNTITYATPEVAGAKFYAQYSFQANGAESNHSGDNNRYAALGASYQLGNLGLVGVVDSYMYGENPTDQGSATAKSDKKGYTYNLGANYDFGMMKVFGAAQYMDNAPLYQGINEVTKKTSLQDGYALMLGTQVPVAAGTLTAAAYYNDVEQSYTENKAAKYESNYYGLAARYEYPLSTRTSLYTGAGYSQLKAEQAGNSKEYKKRVTEVYAGLTHAF